MDAVKAAARYAAKLVPSQVKEDFTAQLATMNAAYAGSATDMYNLENVVKGVLQLIVAPTPIPTTDFPLYYSFGKQIYRKMRRFPGGPQLTAEIGYLTVTYTARGLSATALADVAEAIVVGP